MTGSADETRDFFVSFNQADREWAAWIAWVLEEEGYSVFFQDWDFTGNFVLEMDKAHQLSRRTVAVLSPDYLASRFTASEWAARFAQDATSEHDLLVPVRVRPCELQGLLAPIIYADLVGVTRDEARQRLLNRVAGIRLKPKEEPFFPGGPLPAAARSVPSEPRFPPGTDNLPPFDSDFVGRKEPLKGKRRPHLHLWAALAATSAAALVAVSPVGRWLERELGLPLLFELRGPIDPPPEVVIVAQDVASSEALERAGNLDKFPRTRLAEVVEQVTAAGARALALDLELDAAQSEDKKLADALAANDKAVLFVESRDDGGAAGRDPRPEFAAEAAALAPFPLPEEGSRVVGFWAFHGGPEGRPTLPAAALLVAAFTDPATRAAIIEAARAEGMPEVEGPLGAGASGMPFDRRVAVLRLALRGDAAAVRRLAARLLPPAPGPDPLPARLAAAALRLLGGEDAYVLAPYGPAGRVRRVSYHRVLDGEREALRELEGRIVFIGASEVGTRADRDTFRTVLSGSILHSGVEIAATACLNLLHGDAALTPAWPAMALFAGGAAAAVIAAFAALPPLAALASLPLAGAAATGLACLALEMLRLALPIASALLVSLPLGLLGGVLSRYAALQRAAQRQPARAPGLP